jgi:hypothetical protein
MSTEVFNALCEFFLGNVLMILSFFLLKRYPQSRHKKRWAVSPLERRLNPSL